MLDCSTVYKALRRNDSCERTPEGLRLGTDCLYPSFEQVFVFVVGFGDELIVHDGGGAARCAFDHGVEQRTFSGIVRSSAGAFDCTVEDGHITCRVPNMDWLWAAVASVGNASADAARTSVGKIRMNKEQSLIAKMKSILDNADWRPRTKLSAPYVGKSGKTHTFDLLVAHNESVALIDAVVSHPTSIAAKFLAFSDTESRLGLYKFAVFDSELSSEDKALISNVADLVPFNQFQSSAKNILIN